MKNLFYFLLSSLLFLLVCTPGFFSKPVLALNRIEGLVYDPNRIPVNDVRVELLDEVESILANTKTTSGGRFTFSGVSSGRFIVKVIPVGQNFLEETKDVEIVNATRLSSDTAYVDIYLRYDKRSSETLENRPAEAIFIQDVPKDAKRL